jgi:hypothetical protein
MTIRTAQLAIALALITPAAIGTSYPSSAASNCTQSVGCFKKGTRPHTVRRAPQSHDADYQATLDEVLGK